MLKYTDILVAFREVPNEISLCINLSNCPHKCPGCHSPQLQTDIGTILTQDVLDSLIKENTGISCVCFMGGDNDIPGLCDLARHVHEKYSLKTAWYSGFTWDSPQISKLACLAFDYIKTGPYKEDRGPLTSPNTNQRFYVKNFGGEDKFPGVTIFYDKTDLFWKE